MLTANARASLSRELMGGCQSRYRASSGTTSFFASAFQAAALAAAFFRFFALIFRAPAAYLALSAAARFPARVGGGGAGFCGSGTGGSSSSSSDSSSGSGTTPPAAQMRACSAEHSHSSPRLNSALFLSATQKAWISVLVLTKPTLTTLCVEPSTS